MTMHPDSQSQPAGDQPTGDGSGDAAPASTGPVLSKERAAELGQRLVASLYVSSTSDRTGGPERAIAERLAREHPGQALSEPILRLLVARLIREQLRIDVDRSRAWMAAIATVAGSLWDDPSARARIERLWQSCLQANHRPAAGGAT